MNIPKKFQYTAHIKIFLNDDKVVVEIDHWELFDFIEDELIEKYNFEYENVQFLNGQPFKMNFSRKYSFDQIKTAIMQIPENQIYQIVNKSKT